MYMTAVGILILLLDSIVPFLGAYRLLPVHCAVDVEKYDNNGTNRRHATNS